VITQGTNSLSNLINYSSFRSGHLIAQWVTFLLLIGIIFDILTLIFVLFEIDQTMLNEGIDYNLAEIIEIFQRVLFFSTVIVFLIWIHRAYCNLLAFSVHNLKYSAKWAVWGFFVPILFFYRPYQVVREIWKASDPHLTDESSWQNQPTPSLLKWWWALWLISDFSFNLVWGVLEISIVAPMATPVLAAVLAIRVVRDIDLRQEEKIKRLSNQ